MRLARLVWKIFLWVAGIVLVLLLLGTAFEQYARMTSHRAFPPPGRLVDVGGHRLHLDCRGEGAPTVVLEAGLDGNGSLAWWPVHDEIAAFTRACAYDRAGIAWSDRGPRPRDADQVVAELSTLLDGAGEGGPFVLAGHSLGGIYIRVFTRERPDDVAGLVFVDSSHPDQRDRFPPEAGAAAEPPGWVLTALNLASRVGVTRLLLGMGSEPDATRAAQARLAPQSGVAVAAEADALEASSASARTTGPFGDIPIVVLTAGKQPDVAELPAFMSMGQEVMAQIDSTWRVLQSELAGLSTVARHEIVDDATHYVQMDRPDVVVAAVREVVERVRAGVPPP